MFKTRVLTALILLPLVLGALFFLPPLGWQLFCAVIIGLAAWEWQQLTGMHGLIARVYPVLTAVLFMAVAQFAPLFSIYGLMCASLAFWLLLVPFWLRYKWSILAAGNLNTFLGWALLIPAGIAMIVTRGNGWPLLLIMAIAWIADSFAYFAGKAFGRHKLAPQISPGKSWEGAIGGMLAVLCYFVFIPKPFMLLPSISQWQSPSAQLALWLALALVLTAASVMGDLLESLLKRQRGIKDSSNLLPGHGGILDRIDSLLAILPISAAVYLLHRMPL